MVKKVREYKAGDFIFAKVKGYPAWPARVQKLNGKRYFVYFYGTGETANLPPNMIFDYAENKDKFLTKTVKRKIFNDGVKQIEHDFANNVPLEQVVGLTSEEPADTSGNETLNDSANETIEDSVMDTTVADETTVAEANDTVQNDTAIEDSDENGALVIDEGKVQKNKKAKLEPKTPVTPKTKEPKTPRGKGKKDEQKTEEVKDEEDKKDEEIVSRSGRKIRPKRYIDEQTDDNTTLPSPAPKKRRGTSPPPDKEKTEHKDKPTIKQYHTVAPSELEDIKEPFSEDPDKKSILIVDLPTNQYVGIKLFQSRPNSFKNDATKLLWDKQSAANSLTLKSQLEKGHITPQSVAAQLELDLNLTDEEKAALDKEREIEEKKSRVQFLKTEMKLIELDAKIKTCLSLEKADTELCLKLLDELIELPVRPLMLLKHPTCLETVKRMRAYVGNTPSWDLSESAALAFGKHAHAIRKRADGLYRNMKSLFTGPPGLSFWEYFSERVLHFKKVTAQLNADELLEMVHEPIEMSTPTSHTMKAAIDAANEEAPAEEESTKKKTPVKAKKNSVNTPKPALKRQSSRNKTQQEKEKESNKDDEKEDKTDETAELEIEADKSEKNVVDNEVDKEIESKEPEVNSEPMEVDKTNEEIAESNENAPEKENVSEKESVKEKLEDKEDQNEDVEDKKDDIKEGKIEKKEEKKEDKKEDKKEEKKEEKEKQKEIDEPRPKRTREIKKTEPPPRSPIKRKSKS